jgi:hypothetical protein
MTRNRPLTGPSKRPTRSGLLIGAALVAYVQCALADAPSAVSPPGGIDTSRSNLMAVLRETVGVNKTDETLTVSGPMTGTLPDGTSVTLKFAMFDFIGDMHVRLVFDSPSIMRDLKTEEFEALHLSPDEAVTLAVTNIERVYGKPTATVWSGALMRVHGQSPDFDSSYFLDRAFWQEQAKDHPQGLVVAVPNRGDCCLLPHPMPRTSKGCVPRQGSSLLRVEGCGSRRRYISLRTVIGRCCSLRYLAFRQTTRLWMTVMSDKRS